MQTYVNASVKYSIKHTTAEWNINVSDLLNEVLQWSKEGKGITLVWPTCTQTGCCHYLVQGQNLPVQLCRCQS